jgi:hypothetical protein
MSFCLNDGSALLNSSEPETIVISKNTENVSSEPFVKQGVSPIFAYLTIGLLALIIGGGAVAWIMSGNSFSKAEIDKPESIEKPQKTESQPNPTIVQSSPLPPLTTEAINALLNTWERAQDTRDFSLYKSCYDNSFQGIKRTVKGNIERFGYEGWLNDRRKMMNKAKSMQIRLDKLQISIQNDTATAEFDQYFYVTGYADFGPKVVKIKMTENGAKIIYEELKSSVLLTD